MSLKVIFCSKIKKTIQAIKITLMFSSYSIKYVDNILLQDNTAKLFVFHRLGYVLKYKLEVLLFR